MLRLVEAPPVAPLTEEPAAPPKPMSATPFTVLPNFRIRGSSVLCNARRLDLSKRPMTMRLVTAFVKKGQLTRNELIDLVYAPFYPQDKSERFRDILGQNITKLVSRARLLAEAAFNTRPQAWIEFFVYDSIRECWSFYRLNNDYIFEMERSYGRRAN